MKEKKTYAVRFQGALIALPEGKFIIGRGQDAGLRIDRAEISRQHACIHIGPDYVDIEDLNSINGVMLNGSLLERRHRLSVGDRFVLGGAELELVHCLAERFDDDDEVTRKLELRSCPRCANSVLSTLDACPSCGCRLKTDDSRATQPSLMAASSIVGSEGEGLARTLTVIFTRIDRSLARGRAVEANALAHGPFLDVLERIRASDRIEPRLVHGMQQRALRLASALWSAKWCVFAVELFSAAREIPTDNALDRIEELLPGNERALKPALDSLAGRVAGKQKGVDEESRLARLTAIRDTCKLLLPG